MRAVITHVERTAAAAVLVALIAVLVGLGCRERAQPLPPENVERVWVPLNGTPLRGAATAKVTLVIFSDFQSPYCARAAERIREIKREYGDVVRVQLRHRPLPNYPDSQRAAEACAAAGEQGQFWRFHDVLFAHQTALDPPSLERYAQEMGLDMSRFRDALESERARKQVDEDSILAAQLGVRGAPVVFVNGRPLRGLTDVAMLKKVIDEEIARANSLLASGVPAQELYKHLAQPPAESDALHQPLGRSKDSSSAPTSPRREGLDPEAVYKVEVGESPSRGPKEAKVTLVLWSDFECTQCLQAEATLDAVASAHPKDVRIVWKYRPVPDHHGAMVAAEAALAAGKEGKFWQMHDLIFARPGFERAKLEEYAGQLGLDLTRFRAALEERTYAGQVAEDLDLSERLGVANLPMLFVNGRPLAREALLPDVLAARVQAEIQNADRILKGGVPLEGLYDAIIAKGLEGIPGPTLRELPPLPRGVYSIEVGGSPVRGPAEAPVTLVTFSDFQCPYCARLERTLKRLRARYGDRLRIVWKDAPSPEHREAMGAHEAARAAGEQGRFWEMHDKIFANPHVLSRAVFERYALEIGLDLSQFRGALDQGKFRDAIRDETAYGISLAGPSGTPTIFVNGRLVPGAYPFEAFREIIDEELTRIAASRPVAP